MQVTQTAFEAKYLGLPTPDGRMSKGKLKSLQEKLAKSLMEWGDNHLSMAGKEIKIKAVAQALPVYIMSVFKLPVGLCDDLTQMICWYWWGKMQDPLGQLGKHATTQRKRWYGLQGSSVV